VWPLPCVSLHVGEPDCGSSQPRLTPAEISQRSVDLLLKEYYKVCLQMHASCAVTCAQCSTGIVVSSRWLTPGAVFLLSDGPSPAAHSSKTSRYGCEQQEHHQPCQRCQQRGCRCSAKLQEPEQHNQWPPWLWNSAMHAAAPDPAMVLPAVLRCLQIPLVGCCSGRFCCCAQLALPAAT
jgi:hypothetical protein